MFRVDECDSKCTWCPLLIQTSTKGVKISPERLLSVRWIGPFGMNIKIDNCQINCYKNNKLISIINVYCFRQLIIHY